MSRQYFQDTTQEPPIANLTAVVATTETGLWTVPQFTPIHAWDARPGKIYKVTAGGILSTAVASSTLTITPRLGTTTSGITMGASVAQTTVNSLTNQPWHLQFDMVVRTLGAGSGANSTVIGTGFFVSAGTAGTTNAAFALSFGGTSATVDLSVETGIFIGWTLSVAGSCTPQYCFIQSLN